MCYNSYQLYQIERAKSPAEVRHADEQSARLASAVLLLFRGTAQPAGSHTEAIPGQNAAHAAPGLSG
jgi:hypothetical protein